MSPSNISHMAFREKNIHLGLCKHVVDEGLRYPMVDQVEKSKVPTGVVQDARGFLGRSQVDNGQCSAVQSVQRQYLRCRSCRG